MGVRVTCGLSDSAVPSNPSQSTLGATLGIRRRKSKGATYKSLCEAYDIHISERP
jgi:hypothetical protein